ncbi:Fe(3+) dicitrate ABC transporter substrate-binding protein [Pseudaeromonas sp. ZJS20]|uniref:Fe(3+) dicitrate ABC transporter substrate-binding protein n=1 Tax=Pseudaeromonas aegiceratis TaxID=3153928 RepID=UPI00390C5E9F
MLSRICLLLGPLWLSLSLSAQPIVLPTQQGELRLPQAPTRVVALEFSLVDALVAVGVSPVGIADDGSPARLLPALRQGLAPWRSVGSRAQPSLEVIADLKPDLILADGERHGAIYGALSRIAPTLLLPSSRVGYEANLTAAAQVGRAVGRQAAMQARLTLHHARMAQAARQLTPLRGHTLQFGVSRENAFFAHPAASYAGGVLQALGLSTPAPEGQDLGSRQIGLEQLLALNPDYLLVGDYGPKSLVAQWQQQPLWPLLTAAKPGHLWPVSGNLWSRCRGLLAAELMAADLVRLAQG